MAKNAKILVTGSNGMLGVDLCNELSRDYEVVGLDARSPEHSSFAKASEDKQSTPPSPRLRRTSRAPVGFIQCDVTDKNRVVKSIVSAHPDLIIHLAAWTDVDGCEKEPDRAQSINVNGTENVVNSAKEIDIPLIYISTDFVFDGEKKSPYKEEDKPNPINIYGKSKFKGEKKVDSLTEYIIIRTGWLYGRSGNNFVDTILNKTRIENELNVVNDQIGAPTYTRDLAKAIGHMLNILCRQSTVDSRQMWGIFHISNKGQVSWFDYAREILELAKISNVKISPITSDELDRPAKRPKFSALDNSKFERLTNFSMRPWQEALKEYMSVSRLAG